MVGTTLWVQYIEKQLHSWPLMTYSQLQGHSTKELLDTDQEEHPEND